MEIPDVQETPDVYMLFAEDDEFRVRKTILPKFDKAGLKYYMFEDDIETGLIARIVYSAIQKCNKLLLVLTKNSDGELSSLSLAVMLALEKSLRLNRMQIIIMLMDGLTKSNIPKIPIFDYATNVIIDDNLFERCMDKVVSKVKGKSYKCYD